MANQTGPAHSDPAETARAQAFWAGFTKFMTQSTIAIVVVLVLMAWFLL